MPRILPDERLNRIAQAKCKLVKNWAEGVSLGNDSNQTVHQLICLVAADRWNLSYHIRYHANKLLRSRPAHYRSSISRYYYAMYHSMRACAYVFYNGDDYSSHQDLPKYVPNDFPLGSDYWNAKLKDAREIRNRADYDPYPKADTTWKKFAINLKTDADRLLLLARDYLLNKGCTL